MSRTLPYLTALAIVISSGVVQGLRTGRWSASGAPAARIPALERALPLTIGDWEGRALPLDPRTVESAEIASYFMGRYEDRRGGGAVTVLLVCGRPGPISVHTPEICYPGTGYEQSAPTAKRPVEAEASTPPDEFWVAEFSKPGSAVPESLRVLYGWSTDGTWKAPKNPRWEFAGSPVLYKLYVVREGARADERGRDDPQIEFVRQLLPEIRKGLFSSP